MTLLSPVLRGFIKKEFRQTLRDPRNAMLLFVAPMIQMIVFGYALSSEIKNVRLAVAPSCGDTMLHEISRDAFASGWFIAADASPSKDPFAAIARNKADVVLVPPQGGLTKAIENGRGELQILINAVNVTQAQGIEN